MTADEVKEVIDVARLGIDTKVMDAMKEALPGKLHHSIAVHFLRERDNGPVGLVITYLYTTPWEVNDDTRRSSKAL